ncbi:hypothetical protein J8J14_09595 [Roseomonas sp. SSH11]|uniref:Uncharacterized protein n=1 Tax=Pararoseomonas baculiformis TaxID=2820812 RepID=A0ABS4ADF1_9PROT|nr:hypothetical protein [Pararoseomonas baculiformis]MBP0445033.1 hypothetical protein [Pararoseomonas baculiformis]
MDFEDSRSQTRACGGDHKADCRACEAKQDSRSSCVIDQRTESKSKVDGAPGEPAQKGAADHGYPETRSGYRDDDAHIEIVPISR